jgi:hypothetical protein
MSTVQIAVTPRAFEADSPSAAHARGPSLWARAWRWLIKVQTTRAQALVHAHPEWLIDPSAGLESASTDSPHHTSSIFGQ